MGPFSNRTGVLSRREETPELPLSTYTQRKGYISNSKKVAVYKPGRETSPETEFACTLIMDFTLRTMRK